MPFPSVPLPLWSKPKSRPPSTQPPLKQLTTLLEADGFGLPSMDDPDPFGVLALEKAGLAIKEAGTKTRPASEEFEYRPSPTSPIFVNFGRRSMQSIDSVSFRNSRRDSRRSMKSVDHGTQTADLGFQTIEETTRETSPAKKATEDLAWINDEDGERHLEEEPLEDQSPSHEEMEDEEDDEEPEAIIEEAAPTVQFVAHAAASPIVSKAKLVNIHKRVPPALPPRSPYRRRVPKAVTGEPEPELAPEEGSDHERSSHNSSPTKSTFDRTSIDSRNPLSEVTSIPDRESPRSEMHAVLQTKTFAGSEDKTGHADASIISARKDNTEGFEEVDLHSVQPPIGLRTQDSQNEGVKGSSESEVFHSIPTTPVEPHVREMAEDFS
ncbi:hypothetical protein MMC26_005836 [Xylographa opegraphella]|nr:hypothetical protein [Xylographa opegraphella]